MKVKSVLVAALLSTGAFVTAPALVSADDRPIMIMGEVVRYEPGHVIVVRDSGNKEVSYVLTPNITMPAGVAVGQQVTLYTNHGDDGSWTVTKVTTSVTPEGDVKKTVERTHTSAAGETTKTTSTSINGTVQAYEPGHSVTVTRADGTQVTYMINERTHLPADLAIGRAIVLRPIVTTGSAEMAAGTITYTETKTDKHGRTTTKTKTKEVGSN